MNPVPGTDDACHIEGPMGLFDCLGESWKAWALIIGSAGVVIWYIAIAMWPWRKAAQASEGHGARAMRGMMWIFLFCALCGYATTVVAGWNPSLAYHAKIILIWALNGICPLFLWWVHDQKIYLHEEAEDLIAAAEQVLETARMEQWDVMNGILNELKEMNDRQRQRR